MRLSVLFLSTALLAGCAGFQPVAPEAQQVYAGEVSAIALREAPPEGAEVTWLAGDGSAPVTGQVLAHAWQRPGLYTVTVEGAGGRDSFEVEVLPRPVLRAIPADVVVGFAIPGAWSRFAEYAAFARRFAPATKMDALLAGIRDGLGADPTVPAELVELGIDPAEGIGLATFAFDPDASWILVGILDEQKTLDTVRRLFDLGTIFRVASAEGDLYEGISATGERQTFGLVGGYLAIRGGDGVGLADAGRSSDAAVRRVETLPSGLSIVRVAAPPSGTAFAQADTEPEAAPASLQRAMDAFARSGAGLAGSELFQAARSLTPGDDAIMFVQADDGSGATVPLVVGVELGSTAVLAHYGIALSPEAAASADAILAAKSPPGPALTRYPAGAVAYLGLSFDPAALFEEMLPNPMERALFGSVAADATGVPIDQLIASVTGNVSAGLYFDPEAFTELAVGLIGGGGADEDVIPPLFARVELRGEEAQGLMERALDGAAQRTADGWWQRGAAFLRPVDGVLEIATMRARHLRPKPEGTIDFAPVVETAAGTQSLYVDVAGILEGLRRSEAESAESAVVRALLLEEAAYLEPIRSVRLDGRMVPGGSTGTLRIELQP